MDEREWLTSTDPQAMLTLLRGSGKLSDRKSRLFACAAVRRVWHLLTEERSRKAVEVAEAHADGNADAEALSSAYYAALACWRAAYEQMTGHPPPEVRSVTVTTGWGQTGVAAFVSEHPGGQVRANVPSPRAAATSAASAVLRAASPARLLPWTACEPAAEAAAGGWEGSNRCPAERAAQAGLLRELVGPLPFRLVPLSPPIRTWIDGTVVRLAQAAYEERELPSGHLDRARLAVLADALEEAGADAELVGHLRSPGPHVRGCWAVDSLLGNS